MLKTFFIVIAFGTNALSAQRDFTTRSGNTYATASASPASGGMTWVTVHDLDLPVDFVGTPGITPTQNTQVNGNSSAEFVLNVREPVRNVEVRFLCFNSKGHVATFVWTSDSLRPGRYTLSAQWIGKLEGAAPTASLAYVSRIESDDGVVDARSSEIVREAKSFWKKFNALDLDAKLIKQ